MLPHAIAAEYGQQTGPLVIHDGAGPVACNTGHFPGGHHRRAAGRASRRGVLPLQLHACHCGQPACLHAMPVGRTAEVEPGATSGLWIRVRLMPRASVPQALRAEEVERPQLEAIAQERLLAAKEMGCAPVSKWWHVRLCSRCPLIAAVWAFRSNAMLPDCMQPPEPTAHTQWFCMQGEYRVSVVQPGDTRSTFQAAAGRGQHHHLFLCQWTPQQPGCYPRPVCGEQQFASIGSWLPLHTCPPSGSTCIRPVSVLSSLRMVWRE